MYVFTTMITKTIISEIAIVIYNLIINLRLIRNLTKNHFMKKKIYNLIF